MNADLRSLTFGVELEFGGVTREVVAPALAEVLGGTASRTTDFGRSFDITDARGRHWLLHTDGSLSFRRGDPCELTSPVLTAADIPLVQKVARAIRRAGGRVNATCGMHVHVGADLLSPRMLCNLMLYVYREEGPLAQALAVNDRRRTSYCREISEVMKDGALAATKKRECTRADLSKAWYGHDGAHHRHSERYDGSRYHALNLHTYFYRGTVEFRLFNGTLHAGVIKANIQLALALVAHIRRVKSVRRVVRKRGATKYGLRCVLIELGLNGPDYATTRMHLLKQMPGDGRYATKGGA